VTADQSAASQPSGGGSTAALLAAAAVGVAAAAWALATFFFGGGRFAVVAPEAQAGVEAASAFARLFGALVLGLYAAEGRGGRLPWVAGGLLVMGLGSLVFGYLGTVLGEGEDPNEAAYESLAVRTLAGALFLVGLVPKDPPRFGRGAALLAVALLAALGLGASAVVRLLPPKVAVADLEEAVVQAVESGGAVPGLTAWHWALSAVPLALAVVAASGAAYWHRRGEVPGWLVVAMALLAGSQLHNLFWPSAYASVLATSDLLRLAFAAVVVVGGVLELGRIARERAALLAAEKERAVRLGELAALKADFTAMVAHEFGAPLAAVRRLADVLDLEGVDEATKARAVGAIREETAALKSLVADVQASASVERDDFAVETRPVELSAFLSAARSYAESLPGEHPVAVRVAAGLPGKVVADPHRVGQVLRNLLENAAKYSAEGTPVELRAVPGGTSGAGGALRVRIEVADHGFGVHQDDLQRIFEKFGRGRDATGRKVAGVGLGLYLSRRILRSHGSDLEVRSVRGEGSVFSFELEGLPQSGGHRH
jgi:signal transduction histidine kinase